MRKHKTLKCVYCGKKIKLELFCTETCQQLYYEQGEDNEQQLHGACIQEKTDV